MTGRGEASGMQLPEPGSQRRRPCRDPAANLPLGRAWCCLSRCLTPGPGFRQLCAAGGGALWKPALPSMGLAIGGGHLSLVLASTRAWLCGSGQGHGFPGPRFPFLSNEKVFLLLSAIDP